MPSPAFRFRLYWLLLTLVMLLSGCASIVDRASASLGQQLSAGILDHDDPATVAAGLPAYLLLLDGLNHDGEPNAQRLCLAADLYGAYAGSFVDDQDRAKRLSKRAFDYASRAACATNSSWCDLDKRKFDEVEAAVAQAPADAAPVLFCLGGAWAGLIQANADDWNAIAAIPKARRVIERAVEIDPDFRDGQAQLYLGVMNSLLPPAYGGKPELAQRYFEEALTRSKGNNQMVRVLYARHYARLVFDQALHDRLIAEALAADPKVPGLTLLNTLAQRQALALQASSKDYFE
jgi:tetratricopeptide (TPR) repeat protein